MLQIYLDFIINSSLTFLLKLIPVYLLLTTVNDPILKFSNVLLLAYKMYFLDVK